MSDNFIADESRAQLLKQMNAEINNKSALPADKFNHFLQSYEQLSKVDAIKFKEAFDANFIKLCDLATHDISIKAQARKEAIDTLNELVDSIKQAPENKAKIALIAKNLYVSHDNADEVLQLSLTPVAAEIINQRTEKDLILGSLQDHEVQDRLLDSDNIKEAEPDKRWDQWDYIDSEDEGYDSEDEIELPHEAAPLPQNPFIDSPHPHLQFFAQKNTLGFQVSESIKLCDDLSRAQNADQKLLNASKTALVEIQKTLRKMEFSSETLGNSPDILKQCKDEFNRVTKKLHTMEVALKKNEDAVSREDNKSNKRS